MGDGPPTRFLLAHAQAFDVILSADTLVYFGSLTQVLAAAFAALRDPGLLTFSVEVAPEGVPGGFQINPHGRYAHARSYLEQQLAAAGFAGIAIRPAVLRREAERDVAGWLATARRRSAA